MSKHSTLGHIFSGGTGHPLTPAAERMARYMMANANRIIPKEELNRAAESPPDGRSADTCASEIRKALHQDQPRIVCARNTGYGWIGDPIDLVPIVKAQEAKKAERNDPMRKYAVMTQEDVAKRLGCTPQNVRLIEQRALRKLRAKPELKRAWANLLANRPRVQYDPFHEIWLFQVAETIASNHRHAVDENEEEETNEDTE